MPDRPNVLFLMADQHRADVAGFAGDEAVRTPTLDRLAETGVVFENAYTPSPMCMPARQCLMTGQLPNTCGCTYYGDDLEPFSHTFARHLAEEGYMTACAGKLHHTGWDQMQGWRKRLGPTPMKRPVGPGALDSDADAGGYARGEDGTWTGGKELRRAGVGDSRVQVADRRCVEDTEQFLKQYFASPYYDRERRDAGGEFQPLALKVSLIEPHYPFFTDEERFSYYLNRVEPFPDEHVPDHPGILDHASRVETGADVSTREWRRALAAYYGMVETVDDLFDRVLDRLERLGEDPDGWVIVYTSDHGDMLGEHGLWNKSVFYEASARVPLIVRWPERFDPGVVSENVNLCDLYATLCDLTGVPVPEGLDSRSLVPLLEGDTDAWPDANEAVSGVGGDVMIKRDDLKYQYYEEGPEVLFDLDRDPGETTNYAEDPEYDDAMATFRERRAELGYGPDADPDDGAAGYDARP